MKQSTSENTSGLLGAPKMQHGSKARQKSSVVIQSNAKLQQIIWRVDLVHTTANQSPLSTDDARSNTLCSGQMQITSKMKLKHFWQSDKKTPPSGGVFYI
jgi:hypothetical protein